MTARDQDGEAHRLAGQAVVAWLRGVEIQVIALAKEDGSDDWIDVASDVPTICTVPAPIGARAAIEDQIAIGLAGPAAEERYSFGGVASTYDGCFCQVPEECGHLAALLGPEAEDPRQRLWREVVPQIERALAWLAITALARALIERHELAGDEATRIIAEAATPRLRLIECAHNPEDVRRAAADPRGQKTFDEMVRENPDSFDYEDCRPGPANLSPECADRIPPEHVRVAIAARRRKRADRANEIGGREEKE